MGMPHTFSKEDAVTNYNICFINSNGPPSATVYTRVKAVRKMFSSSSSGKSIDLKSSDPATEAKNLMSTICIVNVAIARETECGSSISNDEFTLCMIPILPFDAS